MVKERFPEMEYEIVGGFFFLRFLCPAIVAPESYGILIGTPRLALVIVLLLLLLLSSSSQNSRRNPLRAQT